MSISLENAVEDIPFQADPGMQQEERPLAGEIRPGEPTIEEIAQGVGNLPDPDFHVTVGPWTFLLSNLTSEDWYTWASTILPQMEAAAKDLAPLVAIGVRSWAIFRNMTAERIEALRTVARGGWAEATLLSDTLQALGVDPMEATNTDNLESLINAAESDKPMDFLTAAAVIYFKPLVGPALSGLTSVSPSTFILKFGKQLPELTFAALRSAAIRQDHAIQREENWRLKLEAEISMLDGFDQFEIVAKQFELYKKGGKLRSFFGPILRLIPTRTLKPSTPIGTPLGSTIEQTPS